MQKKFYYKLRPINDRAWWICTPEELALNIEDWCDGANSGSEIVISAIYMTNEDYACLPEYEG